LIGRDQDRARGVLASLADHSPGPDKAAEEAELAACLHDCLQRLPEKHREVVYLRFYVDDSLEGIAAALGCSVGTAKSRLFYGLEKLRLMKDLSRHFEWPGERV
jgi:RNA polymerase sigma-70 factor (ECF subfamily)